MEIIKYDVNEAEIAKLSDIYMNLTIKDFEDIEGFEAVHSGRMVMVKHRTAIDKLRKRTNEDAQTFIKTNNTNAKKLLALMEPIETHLKEEEGKITKEKERIKAEEDRLKKERVEKRVNALLALGVVVAFIDVAMMSDEDFTKLLAESEESYVTKLNTQEEERLAKEAEKKKLAEDLAKADALKKELDAKAKELEEKEKKLQTEREAIEAEKEAEHKRAAELEAKEKLEEELKIQAEKDAQEKVEREAREKKEREEAEEKEKARQEALRPDKEKLLLWVDAILSVPEPELASDESWRLLNKMVDTINQELSAFASKIKEL